MRILKIFFLFLLFYLQYSLWLGQNGIFDYIKIYKTVITERKNNANLENRNKQIILEIENLNRIVINNKI